VNNFFSFFTFLFKIRLINSWCLTHFRDTLNSDRAVARMTSTLMWSSSWVRTLFFNPIQPDEQNSKPSLRVRTLELAQSSSSDRIACSV
jgi:hypothetical protein